MKLSGLQIFWLMFTFETGNLILLTISPAIKEAKQDTWIAYLIASLLGVLIVYVATKIALLYPHHTLIQFSKLILGKGLGVVIVITYLFQWYSVVPFILRESADFLNTILLPETPSWAMVVSMVILTIYINLIGGIEGIARCSEVFGPIVILSITLSIVLLFKDFNTLNLLPVFVDTGVLPIWKGTLSPLAFLGESVIMLMLVSFTNEPEKVLKGAVWGITLAAIMGNVAVLSVLLTFGHEISAKMLHPAFDMVSYISVMDFIQNVEIIAVLVWVLSVFIKLSLYFFLACYGTAQLFKIINWKRIVWVVSPLFVILALLIPNVSFDISYTTKYWIHFALPVNMIGIPLILLITSRIRKKFACGQ